MSRKNLLGLTIEELTAFATEMGQKPFRGKQLFKWIYSGVDDFNDMSDIPKSFREELIRYSFVGIPRAEKIQEDEKDGTRKFLWRLEDGNAVESVFMKYKYGNSLCISSQVGCAMGCVFCASSTGGLVRNLTAGEMIGQVEGAERAAGEDINHIVVMGMGEPFDNYQQLKKFLELIHHPDGRNLGYRNITVSTSGLIPKIFEFADDFPQVNLAISLHNVRQKERVKIMPVSKAYPVEELLNAAGLYTKKTGRRVTFEYALIRGENDSDGDIELLAERLKGLLCHVNLIPLNPTEKVSMRSTDRRRAEEIAKKLERAGVPATVRRQLGSNIDGACGQLRLKTKC